MRPVAEELHDGGVAPTLRIIEGGLAIIVLQRLIRPGIQELFHDLDFATVSRRVKGGHFMIVHRANGSACLEQHFHGEKMPFPTRSVEGVPAMNLQGQFVVKGGEKGETRGVSC